MLLADPSWIATNSDAATFLTAAGVPVRRMLSPRVHAKTIVADGAQAYLGSENLSATSLDKNREVGLILTWTEADAVQLVADTFEADWLAATAF